jgi:signal transduction histidine kinase
VGLFAVAVVLVSARYFTSRITAPLRELAEATSRVADGHLDQTVDEDLVGELGEAARSFNKMTEDLRRSRDALRYQKQHLENMVQERTAALRQKARELERANRELKEVDRLKSDFLSNVSHELRTPLTSIRSFTEILVDGENISVDESAEFLGIVAGQTDRLTRLIGDLLDLSKIEAGEFHCSLDTMPLSGMVIEPALETVRRLAEDDSITISDEIEPGLPEILADGDRLSQVTMNLIGNAIKFTGSGGEIVVRAFTSNARVPADAVDGPFRGVESDTPESGEYVIVSVTDTGCGIALEDQQRIFDKFGQVGNVLTSKPQGTGLGLAISSNIVIQHRGALWVKSAPDRGSTFYYSIPVSAAHAQDRQNSSRRLTRRIAPRTDMIDSLVRALDETSKGTRALIIDDDPARIQFVTAALEPLGYRAMGCEGGRHAVERARDLRPDVIVLSAHMGDVNGYDVLRHLRLDARTAEVPIVLVGPADEMQKAYELGATVHVEKQKIQEPELALRS